MAEGGESSTWKGEDGPGEETGSATHNETGGEDSDTERGIEDIRAQGPSMRLEEC